jgi:hypothetical protein
MQEACQGAISVIFDNPFVVFDRSESRYVSTMWGLDEDLPLGERFAYGAGNRICHLSEVHGRTVGPVTLTVGSA